MGVYDRAIETALRLIAKYGQVCQWRKDVTTLVDPDKPWLGGTSEPFIYEPSICFLPAGSATSGFELVQFNDGQVGEFSTVGLMGVHNFEPSVTDVVTRGDQQLVIKKVDALRPAEVPVLYVLSIV